MSDDWKPLTPDGFTAKLASISVLLASTTAVGSVDPGPGYTNGSAIEPDGFFEEAEEAAEQNAQDFSRTPPHDDEAERATLSCMMVDPEGALPKIRPLLRPSDFFSGSHMIICDAILEMSGPVDVVTVASHLRTKGRLAQVGGFAYLTELLNVAPSVGHVKRYAEIVANLSKQRKLLVSCQLAQAEIYARQHDTEFIVGQFRAQIEEIGPTRDSQQVSQVLDLWKKEGPLVHVPSGIDSLDKLTGGGPIFGSRWYVIGAPDAGKTAFVVQLGHTFAAKGLAVGFHAVDEEPSDLVQRLAQRIGVTRQQCEQRSPEILDYIRDRLEPLPFRFYESHHTIEAAADDLAAFCIERKLNGCVMLVDSIQTVSCAEMVARVADEKQPSAYESVTANVKALRAAATRHKMLFVSTSEMSRAYYDADSEKSRNGSDMAAAKQSGAIEYSARVLVTLRSVKGESDLIEVKLPKNKHGSSIVPFFLRLNRVNMLMSEAFPVLQSKESKEDKLRTKEEERKRAKDAEQSAQDRAREDERETLYRTEEQALRDILTEQRGIGSHDLRTAMSVKLNGCGRTRVDATLLRLRSEVRKEPAPRGGHKHFLRTAEEIDAWKEVVELSEAGASDLQQKSDQEDDD